MGSNHQHGIHINSATASSNKKTCCNSHNFRPYFLTTIILFILILSIPAYNSSKSLSYHQTWSIEDVISVGQRTKRYQNATAITDPWHDFFPATDEDLIALSSLSAAADADDSFDLKADTVAVVQSETTDAVTKPYIWDAVIVISIRPKRLIRMRRALSAVPELHAMTVQFDATSKYSLNLHDMVSSGKLTENYSSKWSSKGRLTRGQIGCADSFFRVFAYIVQNDIGAALVLEDDADLRGLNNGQDKFFRSLRGELQRVGMLETFDLLYLGNRPNEHNPLWVEPFNCNGEQCVPAGATAGLKTDIAQEEYVIPINGSRLAIPHKAKWIVHHAVVVTNRAARALLTQAYPIRIPVDNYVAQIATGYHPNSYYRDMPKLQALMTVNQHEVDSYNSDSDTRA